MRKPKDFRHFRVEKQVGLGREFIGVSLPYDFHRPFFMTADYCRSLAHFLLKAADYCDEKNFVGVLARGGKFEARAKVNGKTIYLGRFDTRKEARAEYVRFKKEMT